MSGTISHNKRTARDHSRPGSRKILLVLAALLLAVLGLGSCELFQITCETPAISPAAGQIQPGTTISITTATQDALIYYTTDGTNPSEANGTRYTGSFTLNMPKTINAIAVRKDYNSSSIASSSYTIDTSNSTSVTLDPNQQVQFVNQSGILDLNLDLGSTSKYIYFVFSNGSSSEVTAPARYNLDGSLAESPASKSVRTQTGATGSAVRGSPAIDAANRKIRQNLADTPRTTATSRSRVIDSTAVGATRTFYGDTSSSDAVTDSVNLTLRYKSVAITTSQGVTAASDTDKTRILRIWVANDCWTGGGTTSSKAYGVTQTMVNSFADRFLKSGTNNDIYDWVTNIFGSEWGSHSYGSSLIAPTGIIDIVLLDIDGDNSTNGGVLGYFYSRDNEIKTASNYSNESICFNIDAVMFADPTNAAGSTITWSLDNSYWPNEMVSTLAHEFQHMISFYQNLYDANLDWTLTTWVEEMMAMCSEDLVADKIHCQGPRGVAYDDYSSGSNANTMGRFPEFNLSDDSSLTVWDNTTTDYSMSYAFGSWLMRNFGGTQLVQAIRDQTSLGTSAVVDAVNSIGSTAYTFNDLLARFGASVLLSDSGTTIVPYRYDAGQASATPSAFGSSANGVDYWLGDINTFKYSITYTSNSAGGTSTLSGPWINNESSTNNVLSYYDNLKAGSNSYYRAGSNLTGQQNWVIYVPTGVKMTVILK